MLIRTDGFFWTDCRYLKKCNTRLWDLSGFFTRYYWGQGKLGRCVIQLSKFLNHTLATHNQVDSFFENINHNDGKGAFTLTLFEMTITDCPGFHVPHCVIYFRLK
jgi:hypothetical protein